MQEGNIDQGKLIICELEKQMINLIYCSFIQVHRYYESKEKWTFIKRHVRIDPEVEIIRRKD